MRFAIALAGAATLMAVTPAQAAVQVRLSSNPNIIKGPEANQFTFSRGLVYQLNDVPLTYTPTGVIFSMPTYINFRTTAVLTNLVYSSTSSLIVDYFQTPMQFVLPAGIDQDANPGIVLPGRPGYSIKLSTTDGSEFKITSFTFATVPEPATWTMLFLGFGVIGATLRRKKHRQLVTS